MDPGQIRVLIGLLVILGLFLLHKGLRWAVRSRRHDGAAERQAGPDKTEGTTIDGGQTAESGEADDTRGFVFGDERDESERGDPTGDGGDGERGD